MTQRSLHTQRLLHREAFYTEQLFHRGAFTQRNFYTEKLVHSEAWHREVFYTEKLLHTEALHKQNLNTEELLETETGTQRNFHTQKPLHTEDVLHRSFYTHRSFHTKTFTQKSFYPQKLLHTEAFMQRSFCTENSLPIFHHVSFFMIIHHLSPSYLRFHALLVNSLRRLVFISHGVLSVHASSSLPLRRSKINENAEIGATRKMGYRVNYISRNNSDYNSVDIADTACCGELWPLIPSVRTMFQ